MHAPILHDVRLRCAAALLLLVVAGCKPALQDGAYSCKLNRECPSGWSCHAADGRCHQGATSEDDASDAGDGHPANDGSGGKHSSRPASDGDASVGDAGNTTDGSGGNAAAGHADSGSAGSAANDAGHGGTKSLSFAACDRSTSCDGDETCAFGPDSNAEHGVCSQSCDQAADCPSDGDRPVLCVNHECLLGCDGAGTCTAPAGCYVYSAVPMQMGTPLCFELADPTIVKGVRCEPMMAPCSSALEACLFNPEVDMTGGVCGMHCNDKSECPNDGACLQIFENLPTTMHCLQRCQSMGDCNAPLICGSFGSQQVCVPPKWDGEKLLPEPPKPPGM